LRRAIVILSNLPWVEDGEEAGKQLDFAVRELGDSGEAIFYLRLKLCVVKLVAAGRAKNDVSDEAWSEAANAGAGSVAVRGQRGGFDEAEGDDVTAECGIVAVSKGAQKIGFCHGMFADRCGRDGRLVACIAMQADAGVDVLRAALLPGIVCGGVDCALAIEEQPGLAAAEPGPVGEGAGGDLLLEIVKRGLELSVGRIAEAGGLIVGGPRG
jgi:hypothetical protein